MNKKSKKHKENKSIKQLKFLKKKEKKSRKSPSISNFSCDKWMKDYGSDTETVINSLKTSAMNVSKNEKSTKDKEKNHIKPLKSHKKKKKHKKSPDKESLYDQLKSHKKKKKHKKSPSKENLYDQLKSHNKKKKHKKSPDKESLYDKQMNFDESDNEAIDDSTKATDTANLYLPTSANPVIFKSFTQEEVEIRSCWPRVVIKDFQILSFRNQIALETMCPYRSPNSKFRLKHILGAAFKMTGKKKVPFKDLFEWVCIHFSSYKQNIFPWKLAFKAVLASHDVFQRWHIAKVEYWKYKRKKTGVWFDDNDTNTSKTQFSFQPSESSLRKMNFTMCRNIVSYNLDCMERHNSNMVASRCGKTPINMKTSVSMLMFSDARKNDVYLSSDDEDFVESDGATRIVRAEDFVVKTWMNS